MVVLLGSRQIRLHNGVLSRFIHAQQGMTGAVLTEPTGIPELTHSLQVEWPLQWYSRLVLLLAGDSLRGTQHTF